MRTRLTPTLSTAAPERRTGLAEKVPPGRLIEVSGGLVSAGGAMVPAPGAKFWPDAGAPTAAVGAVVSAGATGRSRKAASCAATVIDDTGVGLPAASLCTTS